MPKQIKKRITKKTADTEIDVKDKLAAFKDTIKERQKTLATYGIVVLVIIIAIIGFFIFYFSLQRNAEQLAYDAYYIYYNEYQKSPVTEQERYEKSLNIFKKAYETKKSPRTLLYIASCYYELGKYDDALNILKDFTEMYSNEHTLIPLAYVKIAQVYQRKGEPHEALNTLDTLSHLKDDIYKDLAFMESGRILEREGRLEEAKKQYNEITTRFPNSPFLEEAKAKLSEKKEG